VIHAVLSFAVLHNEVSEILAHWTGPSLSFSFSPGSSNPSFFQTPTNIALATPYPVPRRSSLSRPSVFPLTSIPHSSYSIPNAAIEVPRLTAEWILALEPSLLQR